MRPLYQSKTYYAVTFDGDGRPLARHDRASLQGVVLPFDNGRTDRASLQGVVLPFDNGRTDRASLQGDVLPFLTKKTGSHPKRRML